MCALQKRVLRRFVLRRIFLLAFFGCVVGGGLWLGLRHTAPLVKDFANDEPIEIGQIDFELTDQNGKLRSNKEFKGSYRIVYFGYAHCPQICPLALANITEALKKMGRDRSRFVPIFITLDPERDTVEVLKDHSQNFDPTFVMLTGPLEALKFLQKSYQVYAAKSGEQSKDVYEIDHSSLIYLMGPDGQFLQMFPHTTPPDRIAHILTQHLIHKS